MKEGQKRKERLTSKLLHQKTKISVDSIFFPFFSPTIEILSFDSRAERALNS